MKIHFIKIRGVYSFLMLLCTLLFSCKNKDIESASKNHLLLLDFMVNHKGSYSEEMGYDTEPKIFFDAAGNAKAVIEMAEGCSLKKEDFNAFVRLTKDTVYLYIDYNWVGGPRYETMDACVNEYSFIVANYPRELPFKFVFD